MNANQIEKSEREIFDYIDNLLPGGISEQHESLIRAKIIAVLSAAEKEDKQ